VPELEKRRRVVDIAKSYERGENDLPSDYDHKADYVALDSNVEAFTHVEDHLAHLKPGQERRWMHEIDRKHADAHASFPVYVDFERL